MAFAWTKSEVGLVLTEENIREALNKILEPPLALFSLQVQNRKNHTLIEVSLDRLDSPTGSASLEDCETISARLNEELASYGDDFLYTLQVASCGAERELRLPADLKRFQGLLAKLEIDEDGGTKDKKIFRILETTEESVRLEPFDRIKKKKRVEPISISISSITKGNLFLEL